MVLLLIKEDGMGWVGYSGLYRSMSRGWKGKKEGGEGFRNYEKIIKVLFFFFFI